MKQFDEYSVVGENQLKQLKDLDGGSGDLLVELIALWQGTADQVLNDLDSAISGKNLPEIESLSHKLKGSCANIGALKMSKVCESIEDVSSSGSFDGIEEMFAYAKTLYPLSKEHLISSLGIKSAA